MQTRWGVLDVREGPAKIALTTVTVIAVVAALFLMLGGIYIAGQVRDLSVSLSRMTIQLNALEGMNKKLDTLQGMMKTLHAMDGKLAKTNGSLERIGTDISKMTERITRAKLLF